jgi:hypothetical protein
VEVLPRPVGAAVDRLCAALTPAQRAPGAPVFANPATGRSLGVSGIARLWQRWGAHFSAAVESLSGKPAAAPAAAAAAAAAEALPSPWPTIQLLRAVCVTAVGAHSHAHGAKYLTKRAAVEVVGRALAGGARHSRDTALRHYDAESVARDASLVHAALADMYERACRAFAPQVAAWVSRAAAPAPPAAGAAAAAAVEEEEGGEGGEGGEEEVAAEASEAEASEAEASEAAASEAEASEAETSEAEASEAAASEAEASEAETSEAEASGAEASEAEAEADDGWVAVVPAPPALAGAAGAGGAALRKAPPPPARPAWRHVTSLPARPSPAAAAGAGALAVALLPLAGARRQHADGWSAAENEHIIKSHGAGLSWVESWRAGLAAGVWRGAGGRSPGALSAHWAAQLRWLPEGVAAEAARHAFASAAARERAADARAVHALQAAAAVELRAEGEAAAAAGSDAIMCALQEQRAAPHVPLLLTAGDGSTTCGGGADAFWCKAIMNVFEPAPARLSATSNLLALTAASPGGGGAKRRWGEPGEGEGAAAAAAAARFAPRRRLAFSPAADALLLKSYAACASGDRGLWRAVKSFAAGAVAGVAAAAEGSAAGTPGAGAASVLLRQALPALVAEESTLRRRTQLLLREQLAPRSVGVSACC